jgi:hypothetical protein
MAIKTGLVPPMTAYRVSDNAKTAYARAAAFLFDTLKQYLAPHRADSLTTLNALIVHEEICGVVYETSDNRTGGNGCLWETAGKARAAERQKRSAIADCRVERFDGEPHGGHRANTSRRSATGAVCSPNPAAPRARNAGIPVKSEVTG